MKYAMEHNDEACVWALHPPVRMLPWLTWLLGVLTWLFLQIIENLYKGSGDANDYHNSLKAKASYHDNIPNTTTTPSCHQSEPHV